MSGSYSSFPRQRWQIAASQPESAADLVQTLSLHPLIAQVLINRGVDTPEAAQLFLNPELQILPSPLDEFEDLTIALELLLRAIADRQFIAICGDYDADGMTSTALLLRALKYLGATVDYAIPSRMQEGYGINRRIVEEFHQEGVGLILTVDNGIAAYDPIARARELGIAVIVTDHHDIPPKLPPANAILNPKLIRESSPYRGVAGVGVAYILAICLAQGLQKTQDLTTPLIELFTLGTIADLAPLTGVNRRWVKRGLKLLPKSRMAGIQALIQVAGLSHEKNLKPEAIGFRLGPRINAIGRISEPQIVIELLTTDEIGRALELAMQCEQVNQLRQRLCSSIEQEAIAWCQATRFDPRQAKVLVIVQPEWHHGVIGIVASRLVERYGVPVFIGTYEEATELDPNAAADIATSTADLTQNLAANQAERESEIASELQPQQSAKIRGSARGIPEFDVFEALQFCEAILERFGGHKAAGGFTLEATELEAFRSRLELFAEQTLSPDCLQPLVKVDAEADFRDLTLALYENLDVLHPCGIENSDPVFWTPNVQVIEQRRIGRDQAHLKLTCASTVDPSIGLKGVAWRWGEYYPLPDRIDIAYRLRLNEWNGSQSVELEVIGVRDCSTNAKIAPQNAVPAQMIIQPAAFSVQLLDPHAKHDAQPIAAELQAFNPKVDRLLADRVDEQAVELQSAQPADSARNEELNNACFDLNLNLEEINLAGQIEFYYSKRKYIGSVYQAGTFKALKISNFSGQQLIIHPEQRQGFLEQTGQATQPIDVSEPHYFNLVRSALMALELTEKSQQISRQKQQIVAQTRQITQLQQQLDQLQKQLQIQTESPSVVVADPSTLPSQSKWLSDNK